MKRERIIEILNEHKYGIDYGAVIIKPSGIQAAAAAIEEELEGWISVKERLPEKGGVLAFDLDYFLGFYDKAFEDYYLRDHPLATKPVFTTANGHVRLNVTYWRELPQPPQR